MFVKNVGSRSSRLLRSEFLDRASSSSCSSIDILPFCSKNCVVTSALGVVGNDEWSADTTNFWDGDGNEAHLSEPSDVVLEALFRGRPLGFVFGMYLDLCKTFKLIVNISYRVSHILTIIEVNLCCYIIVHSLTQIKFYFGGSPNIPDTINL